MGFISEILVLCQLIIYQFGIIFPYWTAGLIAGSVISVFASSKIRNMVSRISNKKHGFFSLAAAAVLGAASPICMYGTIPLIAALGKEKIPQHLLAAFMISSILINPNLFIFSLVLGLPFAFARLFLCISAGMTAGLLVKIFLKESSFLILKVSQRRKSVLWKAKP